MSGIEFAESPSVALAKSFLERQGLKLQTYGQFAGERDLCHSLRVERNTRSGKLNEWEARERSPSRRFSKRNL
jgi:hypothetical protein